MKSKAAIWFALAALGGLAAAPAAAQPFVYDAMPPGAVVGLVRSSGFAPTSRPVLQGHHYVLRAVDPAGINVRIVVDAELGEIVSARPLDPAAPRYQRGVPVRVGSPFGPGPRFANVPPDPEWGPDPDEMIVRPSVGVGPNAGAPHATRPARPPLPRSRPVEAAKAVPGPAAAPKPATIAPAPAAAPAGTPTGTAAPTADAPEHTGSVAPAGGERKGANTSGAGAAPETERTAAAPSKSGADTPAKAAPAMPPVQPLDE